MYRFQSKEVESTQNSEEQEQEESPRSEDSSSGSNSDSKESKSNRDSDNSHSEMINEDPNCLKDSTPVLAALWEVTVNQCSGDTPSNDNSENSGAISAEEQRAFEDGYQVGYEEVFRYNNGTVLSIMIAGAISDPNEDSAYRIGILYGVEAPLVARHIQADETKLQRNSLEALGVQTLNITKLKK